MKVALVYDRVNKWGGAERVLLALHELFPDAPLYTSVYNASTAPWAHVFDVKPSFLQRLPFASTHHEWLAALMPMAFESFSFDEFDLVISVTSEAAKGIVTKPNTKHICYCLTPTRYLWSGYTDYFSNPVMQLLAKPVLWYLRRWDKAAANRPDVMIAISNEVKKRVQKYYGRTPEIIYPPVTLTAKTDKVTVHEKGYFLIVSRLVSYKRIDLAIKACNELQLPLKIIGSGSQEFYLRSIAGPTIEFLGPLTDEILVAYYKNCKAFLFPGKEDFGLTVVEAQSFGKPVIAYKAGGALETIVDGKTGLYFSPQTKNALKETLQLFSKKRFNETVCMEHAKKFSKKVFQEQFMQAVGQVI